LAKDLFLSTLSVRRATVSLDLFCILVKISIHALREESDQSIMTMRIVKKLISIHALREESDIIELRILQHFLISIHALREESDADPQGGQGHHQISIHALREESDLGAGRGQHGERISIHALREESDPSVEWPELLFSNFYPRSP